MRSQTTFREYRRSTRVPLKAVIAIEGDVETRTCEGETIVVNRQGSTDRYRDCVEHWNANLGSRLCD